MNVLVCLNKFQVTEIVETFNNLGYLSADDWLKGNDRDGILKTKHESELSPWE